ncbi:MAG TPA: sulfatase-like hydrolase/transferase [Vicinamibacteria bacterium]|jgi:arylsulfatase A-like enzyme/tetratricopeptide (TPR) repeat protein|nr:sulfatase-like hydrolase/transferase [Vicinamibacteria bacterium]
MSVLLITIDTLRADALRCYGHATAETPWIDRLASGGVRFERAHAQNVVTLPSHANILSGRYPVVHGVRDNSGFRFPAGLETLATILKGRGYRTGAFVSAFPLDSRFGLNRGFDVYDDHLGDTEVSPAFHMEERRGSLTVAAAKRWLGTIGEQPSFAWVHLYEPHAPYEPPEPWASRFREDPYHGEVSAADAALEPLLAPILGAVGEGRTLVVLTADHGESLGQHGETTHGTFAYEPTLRVPLILYAPRLFAPRVAKDPVRHVDILPTILDALALPLPGELPGRSLLELAVGGPAVAQSSYFEALSAAATRGWAPLYGVMEGGMKYIDLPIPELYDLAADPEEAHNLAGSQAPTLERMRAHLAQLRAADRGLEPEVETAEVRERLKSLGYAATSAPAKGKRYTEDDDPKRLISLSAALDELIRLYRAGELPRARALGEDIVRRRPMPVALLHLAFVERESGNLPAAVDAAGRAFALSPRSAEAAALLGAYLNESGRARETVERLAPYAAASPPDVDVLFVLGAALAQVGRGAEALKAFEQARTLDPSNAMALVNIGTVHLMARDYPRARAAFEGALALEPTLSRAFNSLGVIEAQAGRAEQAIALWKKAVELNPREYDTLFNLGDLLVREGRASEARGYFEAFTRRAPPALYARDIARVRGWLATPEANGKGSAPAKSLGASSHP